MLTIRTIAATLLAPVLFVLTAAPAALAADVIVVDVSGGAGSSFTSISPAVAAAAPGDVVLVRAGRYFELLELGSKPIVVTAERDALVEVDGILVAGLAAGGTVVVRGIDTVGNDRLGILCHGNAGALFIEDCVVKAVLSQSFPAGGVALTDNANVVLARCTIEAPRLLAPGRIALDSLRTRLHLYDSSVTGSVTSGGDGEDALVVREGSAFLSGATVTGGRGDTGNPFLCAGRDGGRALVIQGAAAEVRALGSTFAGGPAGQGFGNCASGAQGEAIAIDGGTFASSPTAARSLSVGAPVRAGETLLVGYTGLVDDHVLLLHSASLEAGSSSPSYEGEILLAPPRGRNRRGVIDSSGTLTDRFPIRRRGPAGARILFLQPYFRNATNGDSVVGAPATLVILGDSQAPDRGAPPRAR